MTENDDFEELTNTERIDYQIKKAETLEEKVKIYEEALESEDFESDIQIDFLKYILELYEETNKYEFQIDTLNRLKEKDKTSKYNYLRQLSSINKILKNYHESIDNLLEIIESPSKSAKASDYFEIIDISKFLNDMPRKEKYQKLTIEYYQKLLKDKDLNSNIIYGYKVKILELYIDLGDTLKIENSFEEVINNCINDQEKIKYSQKLAEYHEEKLKEFNKAIDVYKSLILLNLKEENKYLECIAKLHIKSLDYDFAVETYEELRAKDTINEERYLNSIIEIYINKLQDYKKAKEYFSILELNFDKVFYKEKIAKFYIDYEGDYFSAIRIYRELIDINSKDVNKYYEFIASIYEKHIKNYDNAINEYEKLITSNPKNKIIYQKSIVRLYWNNKKNSYKTIEKIIEYFSESPDDTEMSYILAEAKNKKEEKVLDSKGKIGEHFEETEKEFKKTLLIYMLLILNIVFLIIVFNKDIFFEKKEDIEKRLEKIEKKKEVDAKKKAEEQKQRETEAKKKADELKKKKAEQRRKARLRRIANEKKKKLQEQKKIEAQKKLYEVSKPYVLEINNIIKAGQ